MEHVTIVERSNVGPYKWIPQVGTETLTLIERLGVPTESASTLQSEALDVLSQCVAPTEPSGQRTGLVVGYVQSGKTASFTTVAALARDNGYRMIIVLSGLTTNLFKQSRDRLLKDLAVEKGRYRWTAVDNPHCRRDFETVDLALRSSRPNKTRTVLLTVMKNRARLDHLLELLGQLQLTGIPVLIIDDEADQASLNNDVRKQDESATYRRLVELRKLLPHHTYLQYTATPQAPLLISLIDSLSPSFVVVLTPGGSYTGGKTFFQSNLELIRVIPDNEIPSKKHPPTDVPASLLEALRVYWLGVAVGMSLGEDETASNRSMMLHPLRYRTTHSVYHRWVTSIRNTWSRLFEIGKREPDDPDYRDLLADFQRSYNDLATTVDSLPAFDTLVNHLHEALSETIATEVNARNGKTPVPDWKGAYPHILTGADVLNRGYTIEGLTVSYMPRGLGTSQADTMQQRARWFGYKGDYLGYCRVYLSRDALQAYQAYVEHEEHMRASLREFSNTGQPLAAWKRAFFLDPKLQPTRRSVLSLDNLRGDYSKQWFSTLAPHEPDTAVETNRAIIDEFITSPAVVWKNDEGHPLRTEEQIHKIATDVDLEFVFEELLTKLKFTSNKDATRYTGLLLQIRAHLEQKGRDTASLYLIRKGKTRRRRLTDDNAIDNIFQGEYPPKDRDDARRGEIYPGDRSVRDKNSVTIQLHRLDLHREGDTVQKDVPALAIILPKRMSRPWLVQQSEKELI